MMILHALQPIEQFKHFGILPEKGKLNKHESLELVHPFWPKTESSY